MKYFYTGMRLITLLCIVLYSGLKGDSCYARSIFVPRQLTYNPILENALLFDMKADRRSTYAFSVKPIYSQNVGSKFNEYFNIDHKCSLNVQENGSGDISSLWFSVTSAPGTFYSSQLSFHPRRQTYGGLFYFTARLHNNFYVSVNTALVTARNDMNICEAAVDNIGTVTGYQTVTQSFANCAREYGRICGAHTKTTLDDVQVKLSYNKYRSPQFYYDLYALAGIPTGGGSKAVNLFEPLVGSKHAQAGLGANVQWNITTSNDAARWGVQSEVKYRYAFKGKECRSFDLCANGQWSRYMLLVAAADPYTSYPAINTLTLQTNVTPRSSFDFYVATHIERKRWLVELGYDLWYRSPEKVALRCPTLPEVGIADLLGIAQQNPQTASTATISQGIQPGSNQMMSDAIFVPITVADINLRSGAQPYSLSNSFYVSIGYKVNTESHVVQIGANVSYELGSSVNTPDNVTTWLDFDFLF